MKVIYKELFNSCVLDELDEGKRVFVLDKAIGEVHIVNNMKVHELMRTLATSRKEETRYVFWIVEEAEEDEEDA